ncbi:hypothetical protein ACPU9B_003011, partial [Klebsiella michiganensis]
MADNEKLGSTSPQILLKNATNLDKLVNGRESESLPDRFSVLRRTWYGMEMAFNRFITYITGRGEQAVGAIGWQELGNWATGLTVDNRQQIVYYNGSWYKYLGELEHVITGDSPENDGGVWSAENPTGKWSNIGDAALRSNLGSGDGLKWVGKCATISALRTVEPTYAGQSITLRHAVSGGHEVNCSLWYDADDLTTADDGYSIFVTAGGARWKADVSRGIDVRLAGLLADNSNLGTVLNAVINGEVNKIKAAGTIKGAITNIFIPASRKTYTVDTSVFIPSFMCLNTDGYVYMNYPSTTGSAFSINNASLDISSGGMSSNPADVQGCKIFNANGGRFILTGP